MTREGLTRRGGSTGASRFRGPVLIVGAGVAGLTTALALRRRGIAATIIERGNLETAVGAGIQVTPNGMAVLCALGVADRLRDQGLAGEAVELRRAEDDGLVARMSLAGRGWTLVHRASLIDVLAEAALDAGAVIEGGQVSAVTDGDGAARITTTWASLREAPLVVGADGLHSVVRLAVGHVAPARYVGHVAWRAVVPGAGPPVVEVHMAPGRHVVTYPLAGGLRNIVAMEASPRGWVEESWSVVADRELMLRRFRGASPRLSAMLDSVEEEVNLWGLHRHPVAPRWFGQHVVLVGDSAHPMLPFLAQGANVAMEDAWALADCLASLPLDRALPAYQARRKDRAARVVAASGGNAWIYHMWRGPQRWALHQGIRAMERVAPGGAISRFSWIYDHDETAVVAEA